ncbi:MAG: GYF domain-containing protein [Akkermansiaceae bacterium]
MAEWFYGKDNTQHGPVSDLEIRTLVSSGQISPDTIIWREGMTDWIPMKSVPEFSSLAGAGGAVAPSSYSTPQSYVGQQPYAGTVPTDGLSIASLVCGILACVTCWLGALFGIPAVICGHMSMKKIKYSPVPVAGGGMAMAGLITGYIGIAMSFFFVVMMIIGAAAG